MHFVVCSEKPKRQLDNSEKKKPQRKLGCKKKKNTQRKRGKKLDNSELNLSAATRPVKYQTQVVDNRLSRSGFNSLEKPDGVGLLVTDWWQQLGGVGVSSRTCLGTGAVDYVWNSCPSFEAAVCGSRFSARAPLIRNLCSALV